MTTLALYYATSQAIGPVKIHIPAGNKAEFCGITLEAGPRDFSITIEPDDLMTAKRYDSERERREQEKPR